MISELARVFSSQGVMIQGTTYASRPTKTKSNSEGSTAQNPADSFSVQFDQASAKLELSKAAKEKMNLVPRAALAPNDPSGQNRAMAAAAAVAHMAAQAQKEIAEKEVTPEGGTSESPESTIKNGGETVQSYSRSGASFNSAKGNAVSVYA